MGILDGIFKDKDNHSDKEIEALNLIIKEKELEIQKLKIENKHYERNIYVAETTGAFGKKSEISERRKQQAEKRKRGNERKNKIS